MALSLAHGLPSADLDLAVESVGARWDELDGMSLFFTGGTGFVGRWMVATLLRAIDQGVLRADVTVLSRDPARFARACPTMAAHPTLRCVAGDVVGEGWACPGATHLVAAATDAAGTVATTPRAQWDTILRGTERTLAEAKAAGVSRALFVSSGAANGPQPPTVAKVAEDMYFGPEPLSVRSVYAEAKRAAELQFALAASETGLSFSVARLWAFIGPLLPLDTHFAAGNFVRDALAGGPIRILGDGTAVRGYQYAADMAAWTWAVLAEGRTGRAYNVGDDRAVDMRTFAGIVASEVGCEVRVEGRPTPGAAPNVYVPDVARARAMLGLSNRVSLEDAVARTVAFHRSSARS